MPISTLRYELGGRFYDTDGVCDQVVLLIREVHPEGILICDVVYETNPSDGELAVTVEVTRHNGRCKHHMRYPASLITPLELSMPPEEKAPIAAPDTDHLSDKPQHVEEDSDDEDDLTEFMDDDEEDED